MRKSDLKRAYNVFEDFKFHDEPVTVSPPENALKYQKFVEESGEVTRFRDDIPEKSNNLHKILSKSNLIRSSLLNKELEDLEEFDPLDKARNKANKQKEIERKERVQNRENIHNQN